MTTLSPEMALFLRLDLPAMLTGTLAAIACGLLGNFLLLRRLSLMGDAIAHSVLPGLVAGFLIAGTRSTGPMMLGAAAAGVATAVLVELIRRLGRVESGAAMGVVFSVLFAAGVVLIRIAHAGNIDLDPDCVLNGQLEDVFWELGEAPPATVAGHFTPEALARLPRELLTVAAMAVVAAGFVVLLFKELRLAAFDPALATALGFNATRLHYLLMVLVAGAVVASFEAVGSILVIAMLICPAATARLLTDRLGVQLWLSVVAAAIAGLGGYIAAVFVPAWLGRAEALSAAGMMTVVAGGLVAVAAIGSPTHGIVARRIRRIRLSAGIAREDLLAALYRAGEANGEAALPLAEARARLGERGLARRAIRLAARRGEVAERIERGERVLVLTDIGRAAAQSLVRSHRLWESFLVSELGLRADHVHGPAESLEHITDRHIEAALLARGPRAARLKDPHGQPVPPSQGA